MEQDKITPQSDEDAIWQEGASTEEGTTNTILTFVPTIFTVTHAALANIATNAFHLYQMPIFQNMLALSYSVTNTIAYSRGTNVYLKGTSFILAAGALYEACKGSFIPIIGAFTSHILFIQTPQAVHTYLPKNGVEYAKSAYMYGSFLTGVYLVYENNYGSNNAQYKKASYDIWQEHANTTKNYTQKMVSWIDTKIAGYLNRSQEYQSELEARENERKYKEWKKCTQPLKEKGLLDEEFLKVCDITKCQDAPFETNRNLTPEQIFKICNKKRLQFQKCIVEEWDNRVKLADLGIQVFELCKSSPEIREEYHKRQERYDTCIFKKTDLEGKSHSDALAACLQIAAPDYAEEL